MKKLTVFSAALMFAGLALAQSPQDLAPGKTRAEVIAELQRARDSGELAALQAEVGVNGPGALPTARPATALATRSDAAKPAEPKAKAAPVAAGKSRAEVVAELQRARDSGELAALQSEIGLGYFPPTQARLSNAPVLASQPGSAR